MTMPVCLYWLRHSMVGPVGDTPRSRKTEGYQNRKDGEGYGPQLLWLQPEKLQTRLKGGMPFTTLQTLCVSCIMATRSFLFWTSNEYESALC